MGNVFKTSEGRNWIQRSSQQLASQKESNKFKIEQKGRKGANCREKRNIFTDKLVTAAVMAVTSSTV
jgi:hypothetical protein